MAANNYTKYDADFKKSLVFLHQNGKTHAHLHKEYGVFQSAPGKWLKQYSTVEIDDGEVLTAKQIKELQKRNAQLEDSVSHSPKAHLSKSVSSSSTLKYDHSDSSSMRSNISTFGLHLIC